MKKTIFFTLTLLLLPGFYAVGSDLTDYLKDRHEGQFLKELLQKRVERASEIHQTMDKSIFKAAKLHQEKMRDLLDFQSTLRLGRIQGYRTMLSQTSGSEIISAMMEKEDSKSEEMCQRFSQKVLSSLEDNWEAIIENYKSLSAILQKELVRVAEDTERQQEQERQRYCIIVHHLEKQLKETKERCKLLDKLLLEEKARKDAGKSC